MIVLSVLLLHNIMDIKDFANFLLQHPLIHAQCLGYCFIISLVQYSVYPYI